jgi:hypothetical protein
MLPCVALGDDCEYSMLERSISYDAAIQLIRRRLQGDRSRDRAREVLIMEALASGEVPMEPCSFRLQLSGPVMTAWSHGSIAITPRRRPLRLSLRA